MALWESEEEVAAAAAAMVAMTAEVGYTCPTELAAAAVGGASEGIWVETAAGTDSRQEAQEGLAGAGASWVVVEVAANIRRWAPEARAAEEVAALRVLVAVVVVAENNPAELGAVEEAVLAVATLVAMAGEKDSRLVVQVGPTGAGEGRAKKAEEASSQSLEPEAMEAEEARGVAVTGGGADSSPAELAAAVEAALAVAAWGATAGARDNRPEVLGELEAARTHWAAEVVEGCTQ